ncbi:MAG: hypothetical protein AAFX98_06480 [Pseudomonadota bacterium]
MIRRIVLLCVPGVVLSVNASIAQDLDVGASNTDNFGKWSVTLSAVASNVAIEIVDSEIELPEALTDTDFEATLSEELNVSSTVVSGSVGYRILPFATVSARVGLISSDTETGVVITGTPNGPFGDVFDGQIAVDRETSREVDGYSLGLGANAFLPIAEIGGDKLAAHGGFQYAWNQFDDTVTSEGATMNFGLVYPVNLERQNTIYSLGGSYNWISREVEQSLVLNGETIRVQVTQEFKNPWGVQGGVAIPIADDLLLGVGVWHQLSGETTGLASLTYRFGTGQ